MKTIRTMSWSGVLSVLVASFASAGDVPPSGVGDADAEAVSAPATPAAGPTLSEIRERAASMPIDARKDMDKRIGVTVERVNKESREKGQSVVAGRLAREFGLTTDGLLDQKSEHGLSWGELVIAHTLLANSDGTMTLLDLATLRSEGFGWGAIAYGLQFHLEDLEEAIKAEGKVAMGLSKADGKTAPIGK